MVRAKFRCTSITKKEGWSGHKFLHAAKFTAITGGSEENEKFFAATPSGSLEVDTVVPDIFEVGKAYYVELTPAE